ncbi:MAG: fibrobacter succinogenes major paralogous domain-containing protein [Fibrobacteres bacterium]|nr:fibrobacter succinogenes major paralogous domain-containing protein [Fibrobacterota bacterium]
MKRQFLLACVIAICSGASFALDLSGTVLLTDRSVGQSGVMVSLASTGASTLTNSKGEWTLSGSARAIRPRIERIRGTSHLAVNGGQILLSYAGRDLVGQSHMSDVEYPMPTRPVGARSTSSAVDTLVYSFGEKIFLRDTVSASRAGIIRTYDTTWNPSVTYGYLTDIRDGQVYRTVKIGKQIWMAQNVNSALAGACPGANFAVAPGSADSCSKYGRLYTWVEAMSLSSNYDTMEWGGGDAGHQGICPTGWHIPSDPDWTEMQNVVDVKNMLAATRLRSTSGWLGPVGSDVYGFRSLPAGNRNKDGSFSNMGIIVFFWSSSGEGAESARSRYWGAGEAEEDMSRDYYKINGFSVRCLKD